MLKPSKSVSYAKTVIMGLKGRSVHVKVDLGRNKETAFDGVLTNVYPALFTVTPCEDGFMGKTSYSYSDYLCGKVRIKEIGEASS